MEQTRTFSEQCSIERNYFGEQTSSSEGSNGLLKHGPIVFQDIGRLRVQI